MRYLKTVLQFGWPYLRRYWGRLFAGILLGLLFALSQASFVWTIKTLLERLDPPSVKKEALAKANDLAKPPSYFRQLTKDWNAAAVQIVDPWMPMAGRPLDWRQMVGGLLFLPLLMLVRGMLGYLNTYCMCWVNERVINDLRLDVLVKLNSLSLDYFNRSTTGDLIARINTDTSTLHRCLSLGFSDLTREPITIVVLLVSAAMVDFKLTLVAFIFLPLCLIPIQILGRKVRRVTQAAISTSVKQSSQIIEGIAGIRVVKAFGLEEQRIESYRQQCRQLLHHAMKTVQARELVNPIMETISMLGLGLLIVYIFYSQTSIPDLVAFLTGVVLCFAPIKKLAGLHVMFQQASVGVERLMQVMHEQPSVKESPQAIPLPEFTTALTFEDVSFSYGNQTVIHHLNLTVPRGFKLGVAGESGSGKSTLVNLIFRFYDPTSGTLKIDGHNFRDVSLRDLRLRMALVSQEIVIFDQTVAENIACGKIGATRAEVEDAARRAYAHEFILQLPQGYDTRVGERGVTLSGGQRQRLAIARAFIRNAPILVLDEATASLDSQSEAEVQVAIDRLAENRTVVCVAHRLSTLATTDQIIVLSQGRIIEQGRYADLLRAGGPFAAMAGRQGITAVKA